MGEYSETIDLLDKYIKILDRILPYKLGKYSLPDNSITNIKSYKRALLIIRGVISKYSRYITPRMSVSSIVNKGGRILSGNSAFTLGEIKKFFWVKMRLTPPNIPDQIPVVLLPNSSITYNSSGSTKDEYIEIRSLAPENIAITDSAILFKRYDFMDRRIKEIKKSATISGRERVNEFLGLLRIQAVNVVCFLSRIHSFLDLFCNRVKEMKDGDISEKWQRKGIIKKLNCLFDGKSYDKKSIDKYKELRNTFTHRNNYDYIVNNFPEDYDSLKILADTYVNTARALWKHTFEEEYPKYIPELDPRIILFVSSTSITDTEARYYVWYLMKSGMKYIIEEVIQEFGYSIHKHNDTDKK